jgi:hypothetical protein
MPLIFFTLFVVLLLSGALVYFSGSPKTDFLGFKMLAASLASDQKLLVAKGNEIAAQENQLAAQRKKIADGVNLEKIKRAPASPVSADDQRQKDEDAAQEQREHVRDEQDLLRQRIADQQQALEDMRDR